MHSEIYVVNVLDLLFFQKKSEVYFVTLKQIKKQKLKMKLNERKEETLQRTEKSKERGAFIKS